MGENVDWNKALGVTQPASVSTMGDASGQKAASADDNGAQAQNVADSAENDTAGKGAGDASADDAEGAAEKGDGAKSSEVEKAEQLEGMSKEDRAKHAARRREEELQAKVEAARVEERQKLETTQAKLADDFIAGLKFNNPFTNKPISTRAEYDAYIKARDEKNVNEGLERAGIPREAIETIIDNHPAVAKARELSAEAERELARAQSISAEERGKAELAEIRKYDPSIEKLEDLVNMENYGEIYKLVKENGLSISQAFKNVNMDAINERTRKAAAQEAFNSVNSKSHLAGDVSHGAGGITVPANVAKKYRALYGNNITQAEIQKKYEKVVKKKG